jgi:hypothetical protein
MFRAFSSVCKSNVAIDNSAQRCLNAASESIKVMAALHHRFPKTMLKSPMTTGNDKALLK